MSKTSHEKLSQIKTSLHREALALLKIEEKFPTIFPNKLVKLLQDIITYTTEKVRLERISIDNIISDFTNATSELEKSSLFENNEYPHKETLMRFSAIQIYVNEIRFLKEIEFRELQINDLFETLEKASRKAEETEYLCNQVSERVPILEFRMDSSIDRINKDYSAYESQIQNHLKNATTLFDIASIESTEKIFGMRSSEERKIANQFRSFSLVIMGIVAFIDIFFLWKGFAFGFQPLDAFSAVALSLVLLTPSIYLSKESNKHRKFEQKNLTIQQNIAAVMSVTSTMDEDDKKKIKQAITTALLENMQPSEIEDSSPNIHFNISEKLVEKFKPQ